VSKGIEAGWDADRIRLRGLSPATEVQVRPSSAVERPAMAGSLVRDGDDLCFVPRFPFVDGTTYTVFAGGAVAATLTRPRPDRPATTEVADIYPTASEVPRNLLRCYVRFTAPMSLGYVADHLRLVDDAGDPIEGALLPADHELWDPDRTRLTVLLDPGRIKRGLPGDPALRPGTSFRLVVHQDFRDAQGIPLRAGAERRYHVGGDERRRVDPSTWAAAAPPPDSLAPLEVEFDRPLDHSLLTHCLQVTGPDGQPVDGTPEPGPGERSWRLTPRQPWKSGPHQLIVNPILEDLAGNSVTREFDRDLHEAEGDQCSEGALAGAREGGGGTAPGFDAIGILPNQGPIARFTTPVYTGRSALCTGSAAAHTTRTIVIH
jgi:hypothetical protein